MSMLLRPHDGKNGLRQPQQTKEVGLHLITCLLLGSFFDGAEQAVAGIINKDIYPAKMFLRPGDGGKGCLPVGDIQLYWQQCIAIFLNQLVQAAQIPYSSSHLIPSFQKSFCPQLAKPTAGSGDK